jgi:hypothetical protein
MLLTFFGLFWSRYAPYKAGLSGDDHRFIDEFSMSFLIK